MEKSPAFQFYPKDFISDENVLLMSNRQVGCYIKLLSYCWIEGSIPKDVRAIAKLCGETEEEMASMWDAIGKCFQNNGRSERLVNKRLQLEKDKQDAFFKLRSEAGKKGMRSRYGKLFDNTVITEDMESVITKSNSSSSSSSSDNKDIKNNIQLPEWFDKADWKLFLSHRKGLKVPIPSGSYHTYVGKFAKWREAGFEPHEVVEILVDRGWRSFNPEWVNKTGGNRGQQKDRSSVRDGLERFLTSKDDE